MPLYEYSCNQCGHEVSSIQPITGTPPLCCGEQMEKRPSFPVMVKFKGEGGYPSRRKFLNGTAPYTTGKTKAWGSYDPSDKTVKPLG